MIFNNNNMRKTLFILGAFCLLFLSCTKDKETEKYVKEEAIPTFSVMNSYLGRSDLGSIAAGFRSQGFNVDDNDNHIIARKESDEPERYESWELGVLNNMIVSAYYSLYDERTTDYYETQNHASILKQINSMLLDENEFTKAMSLNVYKGETNVDDVEKTFVDKDSFWNYWQSLGTPIHDISIWSRSDYDTYITVAAYQKEAFELGICFAYLINNNTK